MSDRIQIDLQRTINEVQKIRKEYIDLFDQNPLPWSNIIKIKMKTKIQRIKQSHTFILQSLNKWDEFAREIKDPDEKQLEYQRYDEWRDADENSTMINDLADIIMEGNEYLLFEAKSNSSYEKMTCKSVPRQHSTIVIETAMIVPTRRQPKLFNSKTLPVSFNPCSDFVIPFEKSNVIDSCNQKSVRKEFAKQSLDTVIQSAVDPSNVPAVQSSFQQRNKYVGPPNDFEPTSKNLKTQGVENEKVKQNVSNEKLDKTSTAAKPPFDTSQLQESRMFH
uniref:Uncharacterized protein n=1 Tax=Panagrolaimus superbus TaxID=310955 RepID=A0A914ZB99_9BILA